MSDRRGRLSASPELQPLRLSALDWSVVDYNYWDRKQEFLLQMDIYPTWCLFAVENGSFSFVIGDTTGTAGSGSLVLCPPNTAFRRSMTSAELTFHYMRLVCSEFHPGGGMFAKPHQGGRLPPILITPGDRQRLFDTFEKWRILTSLPLDDPYPWLTHYWNDVWKTWCLEYAGETDSRATAADELMSDAAKRMEARCSEPYGVKELADELGLSSVQLIRRFRAAYRVTPGDYLTGLRMEKACRLLRETRMTVEQIAAACGYATGYYLSRLFAARIGVSPSEYRKRHRV